MNQPKLTKFREDVLVRLKCLSDAPPGKVVTYADISSSARSQVGGAMKYLVHQCDSELAWHRVVKSCGSLSDKAMPGQHERLLNDKVEFLDDGRVNLDRSHWKERPFKRID